jgi:hypothetical protein
MWYKQHPTIGTLMPKRKIKLGNDEVSAEIIEFESDRENWNTYALADGTTLKAKVVLAEVLRIDDRYAPNGDPLYLANANIVVSTAAPEHLRKKGG